MWADALRVVKEYLPARVSSSPGAGYMRLTPLLLFQLDELQKDMAAKSGRYIHVHMILIYSQPLTLSPTFCSGAMRISSTKEPFGSRVESILGPLMSTLSSLLKTARMWSFCRRPGRRWVGLHMTNTVIMLNCSLLLHAGTRFGSQVYT